MFDEVKTTYDAGRPERPLVIAYYTVDTPYQHEAESLKVSLEAVGYSYDIRGVPNQGSWQKNTQLKAQFVDHMLAAYTGRPLLYLDVDAIMIKPPIALDDLPAQGADIAAVHFLTKPGQLGTELLSGTVWFGNTKPCRRVVQKWLHINAQYPEVLPGGRKAWDQRTLEMAIKSIASCTFVELPQEFTYIAELTTKRDPHLNPVILHTRGAKRFKHIMDHQPGYAK